VRGDEDVNALVPKNSTSMTGEPWAVLIDTDATVLSAKAIDGDVPAFEFRAKEDSPSAALADVAVLGACCARPSLPTRRRSIVARNKRRRP
jgi:hypothetical protein